MADMRRAGPEPPAGLPRIEHQPGLANEMLRELAPLLAEEGIDVDNIDVPDLETLQAAMNRAVERRNMQLVRPGRANPRHRAGHRAARRRSDPRWRHGPRRRTACPSAARITGQQRCHRRQLHRHRPRTARRLALRPGSRHPAGIAGHTALPAGHRTGERAATDILILAANGRAFASLDKLLTRHGSPQVLAGSALALAAPINA